ncbi:hypothetical protein WJX72_009021 [[Myrmecia] bisecta]|uniref:Uncharacterized protein n=1 Tax=[Myrmecia] bisecta TaxID=41462 RepID=A0AAW1R8A3_9CHLO
MDWVESLSEGRRCSNGEKDRSLAEFRLVLAHENSLRWHRAVIVTGRDISDGYMLPANKQGIQDQRYYNTFLNRPGSPERPGRYAQLHADIAPGVHQYNAYWSSFEKAHIAPSDVSNLTCPKGSFKVPASWDQKAALGYTRYHCYDVRATADFADMLALDAAHGWESAAVIWSAADGFRHPNCSGATFHNKLNFGGCPPRADAMADFADFVIFLSAHFNGTAASPGHFTHFILWNENANGDWFDFSPFVSVTQAPDAAHKVLWINKYVDMLRTTHQALARNHEAGKPQMLYVSVDRIWKQLQTCPPTGFQHCHMGTQNFLDGIWERVGTSFDWSVAVHAYGDATKKQWPNMYTFADLPQVVAYQKAHLRQLNSSHVDTAPQSMLAATEQGWDGFGPQEPVAAHYICLAHDVVTSSDNFVYTAHYDFQGVLTGDTRGLVQRDLGYNLANASAVASLTYAAYQASHPDFWNSNPQHFCCAQHQLGCPSS